MQNSARQINGKEKHMKGRRIGEQTRRRMKRGPRRVRWSQEEIRGTTTPPPPPEAEFIVEFYELLVFSFSILSLNNLCHPFHPLQLQLILNLDRPSHQPTRSTMLSSSATCHQAHRIAQTSSEHTSSLCSSRSIL
ncbi:hypothetical protein QQ045_017726 [Rhodiola kirilowii]